MLRHMGRVHCCLRSVCMRRAAVGTAAHRSALSSSLLCVMGNLGTDVLYSAVTPSRRFQSTQAGGPAPTATTAESAPAMMHDKNVTLSTISPEEAWALWNEGNLFSLSIVQMQQFLQSVGIRPSPGDKKAALVRRLEEYLHANENAAAVPTEATSLPLPLQQQGDRHGPPRGDGAMPSETLLDLAQSGFYEGAANMAPKAFQLLTEGVSTDMVVSRVNTTAFPGFPASTECYTLVPSDSDTALRARFSKVFQWCLLNMCNLQMDGELSVSLGKLLLNSGMLRHGESIVSAYTVQQRLQLNKPYVWVTAVPESAIPVVEALLKDKEGFFLVGRESPKATSSPLSYEIVIKRAKDKLCADLDSEGRLTALHGEWVDIHTVHHARPRGPDVRMLLRSRPPISRKDVATYQSFPIVELSNDDFNDVLPPEHGQLVYLSENETRRFERVGSHGIVVSVLEVRRQPLIVLHDEEEDPRVEYTISVVIPVGAGGRPMDMRAVGLEVFELAIRLAAAVEAPFMEEYGCATP